LRPGQNSVLTRGVQATRAHSRAPRRSRLPEGNDPAMHEASRVIAGVSGSPGSLRALRYAEAIAHAAPVIGHPASRLGGDGRPPAPRRLLLRLGRRPAEPVYSSARRARARWLGASQHRQQTRLLVVGAGRRGTLRRPIGSKVCRYFMTHAQCPVVLVPPLELACAPGSRLIAWVSWHRSLTPERILRDRADDPPGPPACAAG